MRKIFMAILLLHIVLIGRANKTSYYQLNLAKSGSDTLQQNLNFIKDVLGDRSWKFGSEEVKEPVKQLVDYVNNDPVDSIILDVFHILNDTSNFLVSRNPEDVPDKERVPGYISENQLEHILQSLNDSVWDNTNRTTISVPSSLFENIKQEVILISADDKWSLFNDSTYCFPNELGYPEITDTLTSADSLSVLEIDSLREEYVERIRLQYNDSLVSDYKDSLIKEYRNQFITDKSNEIQEFRKVQVEEHNLDVLTKFNNEEIRVVNDSLLKILNQLYVAVFDEPYEFWLENLDGEATQILSRNDDRYFHWFWLKTPQHDSLAIRVENAGKKRVRLLTDDAVVLQRYNKRQTIEARELEVEKIDAGLSKMDIFKPKVSPWRLFGKAYWGLTQTYINPYWAKGGNSSASTITTLSYDANYSKNKIKWENGIDAKLGYVYYLLDEEDREGVERMWHKNSDNLQLTSRLGISAFKKWYYSAEASLKTQFFYGFANQKATKPKSAFFSPAYINLSIGMDYKPNKNFSLFASPLSLKTIVVSADTVDASIYKIEEGKKSKSTMGMSGKLNYTATLMENVSLRTKNSMFVHLNKENFLKIPDFDSETIIDFKVNRFITTQLNIHFVFDKDVVSKDQDGNALDKTMLQMKEFITLGVAYKF